MSHIAGDAERWGCRDAICGVASFPKANGNEHRKNLSTGIGGACNFEFAIPSMNANRVENHFSALGDAVGFLRAGEGGLISNNLFVNNASSFFGGAIALIAASPAMANNSTIYGGGLYCNLASNPKAYNSIFWGNTALAGYGRQVYIIDGDSAPEFYYCPLEHGASDLCGGGYTGIVSNYLIAEPQFDGTPENAFHLTQNSPAINSGQNFIPGYQFPTSDLDGQPRIINGSVDMGAYEYQRVTAISPHIVLPLGLKVFYNPQVESVYM